MKEPKLSNLKVGEEGTRQIRRGMAASGSVKITINVDGDSLAILRAKSAATGIPYQRLLNQILAQALEANRESESRLDRIEKEVAKLKKKIVALIAALKNNSEVAQRRRGRPEPQRVR